MGEEHLRRMPSSFMNVFFRVLTPRCGDEPGTIDRWNERKYTSSHKHVPPHWRARWNETRSRNLDDYDLECVDGCQYTPEARGTFLRIADLNENELSGEQKFLTGEYVGVSAFDNGSIWIDCECCGYVDQRGRSTTPSERK